MPSLNEPSFTNSSKFVNGYLMIGIKMKDKMALVNDGTKKRAVNLDDILIILRGVDGILSLPPIIKRKICQQILQVF